MVFFFKIFRKLFNPFVYIKFLIVGNNLGKKQNGSIKKISSYLRNGNYSFSKIPLDGAKNLSTNNVSLNKFVHVDAQIHRAKFPNEKMSELFH